MEYQPILDLASGEVTGREALIRWTASDARRALAVRFHSDCRTYRALILALGEWALLQSCKEAVSVVRQGAGRGQRVAGCNCVRRHLRRSWRACFARRGFRPERLNIEVTETVLLNDDVVTRRNISRLRALGIGLALDDFGTGFSTMSTLVRFTFDKLKIDSSFVKESVHRRESAAVGARDRRIGARDWHADHGRRHRNAGAARFRAALRLHACARLPARQTGARL